MSNNNDDCVLLHTTTLISSSSSPHTHHLLLESSSVVVDWLIDGVVLFCVQYIFYVFSKYIKYYTWGSVILTKPNTGI